MTGAERIAEFRKRNPGYDRKYKAKIRAREKAYREAREAIEALHAKMFAAMPLALPAPAVLIEIPGMNMIPRASARLEELARMRSPVMSARAA